MNRIADYALLGDCHSAALVGRDGSVDWACFPRFDSPAIFCKILDAERGGAFALSPEGIREVRRAYLDETNVLLTTFVCERGTVELTDCMPVAPLDPKRPTRVGSHRSILRKVSCTGGEATVRLSVTPRPEYGGFVPRHRLLSDWCAEAVGGADGMTVRASQPIDVTEEAIVGRFDLRAGDEVFVEAAWCPSHLASGEPTNALQDLADMRRRLDDTVRFWRAWVDGCWYEGEHAPEVRRSALALKALTYAPTGAVVAAPTTSLPEEIGGARNWDYRYTWIRDATLTLGSLFVLGFTEEAEAFKRFLEQTGAGRPEDLQIMYGIGGERSLPEMELDHLHGHRDSRPVRIGNAAVKQMQLDAYGQILESAYLYGKAGGSLSTDNWRFLAGLADVVCERWRVPDQGIWEIRDDPRHFVHSKVNCWVALDRAVRIATASGRAGAVERWAEERDALRAHLLDEAGAEGWFPQAAGNSVADAAALLMPATGIVATDDPRVVATIDRVRADLGRGEGSALLYRYLADDGLEGGEGAFLLCSFWLLDCLTHAGRLGEAEALLDRLLGYANDVGLYAEEVDPDTGEALGNFPQAFSHMAMVLSCAHLSAAKRGEIPSGPLDYAEAALDRLLALKGAAALTIDVEG